MDDCNLPGVVPHRVVYLSSDSSMDDCNQDQGEGYGRAGGSDSSMDDCNPPGRLILPESTHVQIPLWTIVTVFELSEEDHMISSDSSMDDCNKTAPLELTRRC